MHMNNWNIISAESEARRICDERGITDFDDFQRIAESIRHQGFMRSIEPYTRMMARVQNTRMISRIILRNDVSLGETIYEPLSPEAQKLIDGYNELIAAEAVRWGFQRPSESAAPQTPAS